MRRLVLLALAVLALGCAALFVGHDRGIEATALACAGAEGESGSG